VDCLVANYRDNSMVNVHHSYTAYCQPVAVIVDLVCAAAGTRSAFEDGSDDVTET
jgi:hypothetical protein